MDGLPTTMPRKRDEAMVADFDTELVVLVPEAREAHLLDEGLSLVLDSCDGVTPTADVIAEVADATGDTPAQVAVWLANSIQRLVELDIVVEAKREAGGDT
jgi:hypothetical protein